MRGQYRCEADALKDGGQEMAKDFKEWGNSDDEEKQKKHNHMVWEATEKNGLMDPKSKSKEARC